MEISFHKNAFEDYIFLQKNDKKTVERINKLLKDIAREPFSGIGKPEALKHNLSGLWSRRISNEHRLVSMSTKIGPMICVKMGPVLLNFLFRF